MLKCIFSELFRQCIYFINSEVNRFNLIFKLALLLKYCIEFVAKLISLITSVDESIFLLFKNSLLLLEFLSEGHIEFHLFLFFSLFLKFFKNLLELFFIRRIFFFLRIEVALSSEAINDSDDYKECCEDNE